MWGTIPCNEYMTFNPVTHAAAVSGIAFIYNNPGTVSVENVTLSYGSIFLGATVTTDNLLGTIYTPSGTIGPVQPDGSFDNSYHYVGLEWRTSQSRRTRPLEFLYRQFRLRRRPGIDPGLRRRRPLRSPRPPTLTA